ncbi:tetratricopeptide repeat protein [Pararcticibacter amylolyticus]|uniref:Tetratricopeptide repeat protein n=1 Tax=Pararcticibacter amylolyticus TaxID=2173175 RepID=A0A2U2PBQ8_9SPHI|nr:tetratricopeptide repeat protein [Pararcticibacter amylolyticus]PWG78837.1 hypothetical protein DDR33_20650 [Pararcticibacter amylolyticus]
MKRILLFLLLALNLATLSAQTDPAGHLASQYLQSGDWEKALTAYRNLFNQGRNPQHYDQYIAVLLKLKKYEEAKLVVKNMMNSDNDSYIYKVDYGRILQEEGSQEKADNWYKGLIRDLPANEYAIRELAVTFYRANAYDYAVKALQNGRKLLKKEDAFTFDLLSLYRFQKNKEMLSEEYLNVLAEEPNPSLLNQAKSTFASVFESVEDYAVLKNALLRKLQKRQDHPAWSDLLSWVYLQQRDFDQALKLNIATDKRLKEDGYRVYGIAEALISNKEYATAIKALDYLTGKGPQSPYYVSSKAEALRIRYQMLTDTPVGQADLLKLENDYQSLLNEFGATKNTVFAMRQLADLKAFYLKKPPEAEKLLEEVLKIPQLPLSVVSQTKLELGDVYILSGELWEAALIYGQAEKEFANEPAGQEAKYRNARLSYFQSDFEWAKTQLDVLKSSTSQLIANDALNLSLLIAENTDSPADTNALVKYAYAERLTFSRNYDQALKVLDSIGVMYPGNSLEDDVLMAKARILLKQNNITKAIESLVQITVKYHFDIWGDDALFMLGDIYQNKLHDTEKAMTYYQKLITDFPGSLHVNEARNRFRNLRGDNLG